MGDLIQFRPRAAVAVAPAIPQVQAQTPRRIWPPDAIQYAMDDDTSPCELNPDPFEEDMNGSARESAA